MSNPPGTRSPRTQLLIIVAIAVLSLGGAYGLFYAASQGGLWGTTNHGTFVNPPLTVAELDVVDSRGVRLEDGGTWWLWVVPQGHCDVACEDALHQLRQLHVLLNRDASRVRRALVTAPGQRPAAAAPDLEWLRARVTSLEPGIYVVDPIGNLVFHYPLSDAGEPVLDDLKRLLKVSQIG